MSLLAARNTLVVSSGASLCGWSTVPKGTFEKRPGLRAYDNSTVIVGVRPEDLEAATLASDIEAGTTVTSTVDLTEALGSEIVTHFELDAPPADPGNPGAADDTRGSAVAHFDPRSTCRAGDPVEVAVTAGNLHFFDLDTQNSIWD